MANPASAATDFRLLGPVEVVRDGKALALGGRRQRMLLALLLLDPGRLVSADRLIDELWGGRPPAGAETTLRAYVSRLRSALGVNSIFARTPGYVLELHPTEVDSHRFEQLTQEGRDALARGAAGLAASRLRAGLALWRGPALSDVAEGGLLALEAQRLDELHVSALEERIDADLALGRHADLVSELEQLVRDEPLRERLWRQLMLSLCRCERQADALDAYRRAHTILSEGLGLEPSEELRALERAVLRHEVPAIVNADEHHNLPMQVTSFVGRDRELGDLELLLREERLLTLTGTGGAGKTRLALETASRQIGAWRDGVWLLDLTGVADGALVPNAAARVLAIAVRPDLPTLQTLTEELKIRELLLVLDNCEHLADACGELVNELLRTCQYARVLATSRVVLGVAGEVAYSVEPLPTPTAEASAEELQRYPSVRVFLDRSRAVRRDLATDGKSLQTIGQICRELDGVPLAIELAAARTRTLSVGEIAARLDDRFRFLRSWRRLGDPRHQTLRATIDWSYNLLPEPERELLGSLSVFAGGFNLAAAAAICLEGDDAAAVDLVERLGDSSLVVAENRDGVMRYRLLDTIRRYCAERLEESGAAEALRRRHAEHFLELAKQARPDYIRFARRQQDEGLAVLDRERDNVHAAQQWTLARQSDLALPLATALRTYWLIRGYRREGLEWLERALDASDKARTPLRAEALAGAALLARLAGEFSRAEQYAREGVAIGRATGTPIAVATGLNVLATLAGRAGDFDRARTYCDESVAVAKAAGSQRIEALALFILAETALHARRYDDVRDVGNRALELFRELDDREGMSIALARLGMADVHERRFDDATSRLGEALEHVEALGFAETGAWCCEGLAVVAADSGHALRAARLLGAAETLRRTGGGVVQPAEASARERALNTISGFLGEEGLTAALQAGRLLTLSEAVTEARDVSTSSHS